MRYILVLFLIINSACAQTYKKEIVRHREAYKQAFLKEKNSPLRQNDFEHLHFFEADSVYKVIAKVEILKRQDVFRLPTFDGTTKQFYRYALLKLDLKGEALTMTLYQSVSFAKNPYSVDLLFLPFTDKTNDQETYAGGRYIDLSTKQINDDAVEIDFNKAYNPYCAYSSGYQCPMPPDENNLKIAIKAGEQLYTGKKKHRN